MKALAGLLVPGLLLLLVAAPIWAGGTLTRVSPDGSDGLVGHYAE